MKTIVAYSTRNGNTAAVAERVVRHTRGERYRIEREIPYSKDDYTCAYKEEKEGATSICIPPSSSLCLISASMTR